MTTEEHLSFELQEIFDEFTKLRDAYISLKTFCGAQEETLTMERERSKRLKENLEKLSKTYLLFERRHKSTVEQLKKENEDFQKTVEELNEQCDYLRLINVDRNDNEQIRQLQEEIEVLKSQLLVQTEKYNEDIDILKQQHSDEVLKQKVLLQVAKQAAASSQNRKRGQPNNADKSRKNASCFRWPELSIDFIGSAPTIEEGEIENRNDGNKRRKLYHEDNNVEIDIV